MTNNFYTINSDLEEASIAPVSIREIINMNFFPSYQMGCRWDIQQVKELLDDIEEFCVKGAVGIYL